MLRLPCVSISPGASKAVEHGLAVDQGEHRATRTETGTKGGGSAKWLDQLYWTFLPFVSSNGLQPNSDGLQPTRRLSFMIDLGVSIDNPCGSRHTFYQDCH